VVAARRPTHEDHRRELGRAVAGGTPMSAVASRQAMGQGRQTRYAIIGLKTHFDAAVFPA